MSIRLLKISNFNSFIEDPDWEISLSLNLELENLQEFILNDLGFSHFGVTSSTTPIGFKSYSDWLDQNYHADMEYLYKHKDIKSNLKNINSSISSIISLAHPYRVLNQTNKFPDSSLNIAMYARDEDYHHWLNEKLSFIIQKLKTKFPNEFFMHSTDSFPILERDFGFQNQIGWIGKNSCLIHPKKGSLFLIGNILTSATNHSENTPIHDFCGKCTRCIDACPTNAINKNKTINSNLCVSYWTIESKSIPPIEIRSQFKDLFYGCDICQTICPWNGKILSSLNQNNPTTHTTENNNEKLSQELSEILKLSGKQLLKKFANTPLTRASSFGLKRNALIVIGNLQLKSLIDDVQSLQDHPRLGDLAKWCHQELSKK